MARKLKAPLRAEYDLLFSRMTIRPEFLSQIARIGAIARSPTARAAYRKVETEIGVPWFVTALIHNLESSQRFDAHLHNGDPLTHRTRRVPSGRLPDVDPPYQWHQSAVDALKQKSLHKWTDWSIAGIAFVLEGYNGFGYRNNFPHIKSPYLWSFSSAYSAGKYIADGRFSETAVSKQCGGMVLLRHLMDHEPAISAALGFTPSPAEDDDRTSAADFPSIDGPEGNPPLDSAPPAADPPMFPGRYLMVPIEDDAEVERVQRRLRQLNIDAGSIDGDYGVVTEHAVRLFQSRSATPSGEPLEIDGIVGPQTWVALFGERSLAPDTPVALHDVPPTLARALVDIAAGEVGVREVPLGSNRGPRVDEYIRSVGLDPAADSFPWCMCFVHWCHERAATLLGMGNVCPRNAGVHLAWQAAQGLAGRATVVSAAEARRNPNRVVPGMVFFIDTGGGRGHVGIVAANTNASLETIEGNTNDNGSREGIGVFRRSRRRIIDISLGFAGFWS